MQPHVHQVPRVAAPAADFLPHGYCYLWNKPLLLTHVTADLLIGISYVAISVTLALLVHRARRDIPFSAVFVAFGLFIVTCGMTHFLEVWTLWHPAYWLSGGVKAITAAASVATAVALPFVVPQVHVTIRDAKSGRAREVAAARATALEERNAQLATQAAELAAEREAARALAERLERVNADLRRAEAEARAHLDALEATYQSAPVGLCVLDADLRFVRINARLAEINGSTVDAHRGRALAEVVPALAGTAEPILRRVLATGEPVVGLELSGETPAAPGVHRTWVESWYPLRDATGSVVGVNVVAEDVTERRRDEAARRASDARYRALVEAAPLIAWSQRSDGTIDFANERWAEYTGRAVSATAGTHWSDVVHPDDAARVRTLREYATVTEEPLEIEARFRRHDGAYRWHVARVVPVRLGPTAAASRTASVDSGPVVAWYGAALDIEDRKREAAELAQTVGELQRANAELARLTDDLRTTNEELEAANVEARAARTVAEHASEAKTQFLATMSHELRTPLNAVLGYVDLLDLELAGPLTGAQRGYLDRVTTSARHLLGLINEVLDLAKVEAGQMTVALQPTGARAHVLDAVALIAPQAARKELALDVAAGAADDVRVLADPDRLRQVLVNLLSNAVKFTALGGSVTVRIDPAPGPGPLHTVAGRAFVRVDVCDTGVGIPADRLDAVFEPFVQVEAADADRPVNVYTRRHGGTGLGLTIARRLTRLMGGDLTLESTPGRGSRFSVWLPLAPATRFTPAWTPAVLDARALGERP